MIVLMNTNTDWCSRVVMDWCAGFQSLESDEPAVRQLMQALVRRMGADVYGTTGRHIAMICNGLQKASADNDAVEQLLEAVAQRIEQSCALFTFSEICTAVYGLQVLPHGCMLSCVCKYC